MRIILWITVLVALVVLVASPALGTGDTLYACLDGEGKLIRGEVWDQPHDCRAGGQTTEMTKSDPRFIAYRTPVPPTQQQLDDEFDRQVLSNDLVGPLVRAIADHEGMTVAQWLALMRAKR